jgi:hypothetical protein
MKVVIMRHSLNMSYAALLVLGACSGSGSKTNDQEPAATGGSSGSGGGVASGGAAGSGGVTGSGGIPPSDASGGTSAGTGGGSVESGVTGSGGLGGAAGQGGQSGADGGSDAGGCTRDLLKSTIDAYFTALAAHDPSPLPLADGVKFTENGNVIKIGEQGLWKSAGKLKYAHSALDPETCSAASEAVVPDGSMDIPFALRIRLQDRKITEIETIAVRPGDYKVSGANFPSNTAAIIASADAVRWLDSVPANQRNSRAEMTAWMDKYFKMFPRGVCNVTSSCRRLENGGGSFSCSAGASCDPGQPGSGPGAIPSRTIFADVETGIGVGFSMFMGNTDMHMFKMYGGQVYAVHAILGAAGSSGWE